MDGYLHHRTIDVQCMYSQKTLDHIMMTFRYHTCQIPDDSQPAGMHVIILIAMISTSCSVNNVLL